MDETKRVPEPTIPPPDGPFVFRKLRMDCPECVANDLDPRGELTVEWVEYNGKPDMGQDSAPSVCPVCHTWWEGRFRRSGPDDWYHRFSLEEMDPEPDGGDPDDADMVDALANVAGTPATVENPDGTYTTVWMPNIVPVEDTRVIGPGENAFLIVDLECGPGGAVRVTRARQVEPETLPPGPGVGMQDAVRDLTDLLERQMVRALLAMPFLRGPDGDR